MDLTCSRRAVLSGLAAVLAASRARASAAPAKPLASAAEALAAIERREGGRLGVAVLGGQHSLALAYRAEERFAMCSTFKLLAAAAVLGRIDAGLDRLDRVVPYGPDDLTDYAPVTRAHVDKGGMTLGELCAAAIQWSDNTAGNLVLGVIDGPAGFTRFARGLGDPLTRLDRNEPTLNTAIPGDDRDTTTPAAMVRDMQAVLLGEVLSVSSRRQLETWLVGDKVGGLRLRAGLPASWQVGDKTGSGENGTTNTIAILRPPDRDAFLVAVYATGSPASADRRNAVHKEIGELIASTL